VACTNPDAGPHVAQFCFEENEHVGDPEKYFCCYPQRGECDCGVVKEHVHCKHGGVIQVG
jgi:hypothetical protein